MIRIERLDSNRSIDAAGLFTGEYARMREAFPMLSESMADPALVSEKLAGMGPRTLAAIHDGGLVGYLAWWVVESFRGSGRIAAYVPEWGHGALAGRRSEVYRALYRAAAAEWTAAGCRVHAITVLAGDPEGREAWFWNGFGLAVVDAVRPAAPLTGQVGTSLAIRRATVADAERLAELDAEHVRHYSAAPVYMAQPAADNAASFREFIDRPKNTVWLALAGDAAAGFMRFTGYDFDAVAVLQSDSAAFCNAAFVRPEYRGRHAGRGLLNAALEHYATQGMAGVFTNFESFNPEAASFWPRYFSPVCFSLMRVPEVLPSASDS